MKTLIQFVAGIIGSIVFGIIGLIFGATIGGNYVFTTFGESVGYEAGGIFLGTVGMCLGSLIGTALAKKLQRSDQRWLQSLITTSLSIIISIILYSSSPYGYLNYVVFLVILILPSVAIVLAPNFNGNKTQTTN